MSIPIEALRFGASWRSLCVVALAPLYFQGAYASRILTSSLVGRGVPSVRDAGGIPQASRDHSHVPGRASEAAEASLSHNHVAGRASDAAADASAQAAHFSRRGAFVAPDAENSAKSNHSSALSLILDDAHGVRRSSLAALAQHSALGRISILMFFVLGCLLLLCLCFCCCWFELLSTRKHRAPRHQHLHNDRVIYEWDQSPKDASIYIKPPEGLKQSDFEISIKSNSIKVGRKSKAPFLSEQLYDEVDKDLSGWTLRSSGELQIRLVKAKMADWPVVCSHQKPQVPSVQIVSSESKPQAQRESVQTVSSVSTRDTM